VGGGGLVVGFCFEPDSGPAQQVFHDFQECREWDFGYFGSSDDKNQVYAPGNTVEKEPNCFAQSSSGAVPFHCVANFLAYHKAAACSLVAIGGNIEPNQRKAQGSPFASHLLKLVGALQTIDTLHRCVFTTLVFMSLKRGQMRSTVGRLVCVSASAPLPLPGKCIGRGGEPIMLAMATADGPPLIAYGQFPSPFLSSSSENFAAIFRFHSRKEAMLTATGDTLWLPCSFRHWFFSSMCKEHRWLLFLLYSVFRAGFRFRLALSYHTCGYSIA
jgi:hypothetical protein